MESGCFGDDEENLLTFSVGTASPLRRVGFIAHFTLPEVGYGTRVGNHTGAATADSR